MSKERVMEDKDGWVVGVVEDYGSRPGKRKIWGQFLTDYNKNGCVLKVGRGCVRVLVYHPWGCALIIVLDVFEVEEGV